MSRVSLDNSSSLISVVIPTLNCARELDYALDSLLSQSFADFEIIISDGGSHDGTVSLAMQKVSPSPIGIRSIMSSGSGIYSSMNLAMKIARGEWIYFLGSDDSIYSPQTFEVISAYLESSFRNVIYGDVWSESFGRFYDGLFDPAKLLERNISHQAIFYRRGWIETLGVEYNERYRILADWDFNIKMWSKSEFMYVPVPVARYGKQGISSHVVDELFLEEKEANAIDYFGVRSYFIFPVFRLALGTAVRPNRKKTMLTLMVRSVRAVARFVSHRMRFS